MRKPSTKFLATFFTLLLTLTLCSVPSATAGIPNPQIKTTQSVVYNTKPLDIVKNPVRYMGKNIKMTATFDKFSTLGLDYSPVGKTSKEYIGFLVKRDDVIDHTVPLSEMKLFLKRSEAEKFIDLSSGDIVEIQGKVISIALGDPWIETTQMTVIKKIEKKEGKK